ncbi:MAG: twin-arginine translocase subunit TatC [Planctomycetota bacterium]|nr:twin-arginine translocase subunit TatC [Planctomycetota bacterium]
MTLGGHLAELQKRLFRSVLVLAIAFGGAWWFKEYLVDQVMWPLRTSVERINAELVERYELDLAAHPEVPRTRYFRTDKPEDKELREPLEARPTALNIGDPFFFALNVSIYFACFFAGPFVLWQIWQFIAAGLYSREKRLVYLYFPFSILLFLAGVMFCFLWIVPTGMYYLSQTLPVEQVRMQLSLNGYFEFLSTMCLAMGAMFQLPLVMIFLSSIGLIEPRTYARYRPHFLIGALFVAGVITPGPDWISQVLMTAPIYVLYEVGIIIARWRARPRRHPEAGAA